MYNKFSRENNNNKFPKFYDELRQVGPGGARRGQAGPGCYVIGVSRFLFLSLNYICNENLIEK